MLCAQCKGKGRLLTVDDLAEYLRVNKATIYRMARNGELPAFKVHNMWRFRKDLIDEWLEQHAYMKNDD